MARFHIYAAMTEDLNQGWVWIRSPDVKDRQVVCISNPATGLSTYCEAISVDEYFLHEYNKPPRIPIIETGTLLVISAWYRRRLGGISTKTETELEIVVATDNPSAQVLAALHHPQVVVRIATILALIGIVFGIAGIVLGIMGLEK